MRFWLRLLVLTLALTASGPAFAQVGDPAIDKFLAEGLPPPDFGAEANLEAALAVLERSPGTIVAEIDSRPVTWGDIADVIRAMPPIASAIPLQKLYQNAAAQALQQKALAIYGEKAGLDKDPVVQRRIKSAADQVMANEVLHRSLQPNVADDALRPIYDALIAGKPGPEVVRARIIMVYDRADADSLIHRLQAGGDFSALARDFSKDGTAKNGGDLGFVRLDMLAPEIGSVIFALAPGQITAFPVRSGAAWFIIKVEGRDVSPPPTFEEARDALKRDVIHAGVPALLKLAFQPAAIKYYGMAGKQAATEAKPK
jgi:peptidyl-prolyl cis-trans isomerase C